MANVMICEPRLSDAAVLTASGSGANFPVSGLQRMQLYNVWRPDALTCFVVADLGAARDVRSVALISCAAAAVPDGEAEGGFRIEGTASAAAQWRVRAAADAGDLESDPGYDSGWTSFRQNGAEDDLLVQTGFMWVADGLSPRQFRYWRIDIDDATNVAGFADFGRLYISDASPFGINMSYGAGIGFDDPTRVNQAVSGTIHAIVRTPVPLLDFAVEWGTEAEMLGRALALDRRRGTGRDVLALMDHAHPSFAAQRTVYGTMESLGMVTLPYFNIFSKRYRIRGIMP